MGKAENRKSLGEMASSRVEPSWSVGLEEGVLDQSQTMMQSGRKGRGGKVEGRH